MRPRLVGCFQYTVPDASVLWFPTGTTASITVSVPNDPNLSGLDVFGQSASFEPSANTFGLISSNGVKLTVGS